MDDAGSHDDEGHAPARAGWKREVINPPAPIRETILVVEDEKSLLGLLIRTLTTAGYGVLSASSAEEAMLIAAEHAGSISLLITDVVLPEMSGPALSQQLLERRPQMRVLFMSGYTHDVNERLRHFPNADLLTKPFKMEALLVAMQEALRRNSETTFL